jgi:hypothetical protein
LSALAVTVRHALVGAVFGGARTADLTASVGTVLEHKAGVTVFGILAVTAEIIVRRSISIFRCTALFDTPVG